MKTYNQKKAELEQTIKKLHMKSKKELEQFARDELTELLYECTTEQQHLFKRMYVYHSGCDLDDTIPQIVYRMPEEKLNWALQQVQRTIEKNELE